jgi:valyl-tRNA synthetase
MNELPTKYEPSSVESSWSELWAKPGTFRADATSSKPAFTIVIPPPNVTGSLHLGHALDNTIIDVLTRFKRMAGFEALYLPGTDHAGISTQVLVEKELALEGLHKSDLGREKFLERVWAFKEKNGGTILRQLTHLGVSADWSRERFTMDAGLSKAVRRTFVEYVAKGMAYRGEKIVNWDPVAQTVLSDLEVDREDRQGKMYTLAYALEDGSGAINVATVRPETIFADQAVAVHPDDVRFSSLVGQNVRIPLTDRLIPIIADSSVEMDFGTGCLKITPAHDPTDFEIGLRHNLATPSVIDKYAKMVSDLVPEEFRGMERFAARKAVVKALEANGALLEAKDYKVSIGISERTKEPIEPMVMTQWWCKMDKPAKEVLSALEDGRIKIVPERYTKVNRDWLENIREWAIGRQLWWGHQIPAWYDSDGKIYVPDLDNPDLDCDQDPRYAHLNLTRDPDVFDTWFSSALWNFSTMGYPDQTEDLAKFYPNSVLVTGYDILFFWVARMQMAGFEFTGQAPFHTVMLHGLYLDAKGQKMSKSKNNGIDPLELMDKYGVDGCRFAWAYLSTGGQDIKHDERRYEMGRNFANKLWNASRFAMMNLETGHTETGMKLDTLEVARFDVTLADAWIISKLSQTIKTAIDQLEAYDLGAAIRTIYSFTWDDFCDWYIEAAKPALKAKNPLTQATIKRVLEAILKLLHPFMPFITSEIYAALNPKHGQLAFEPFPRTDEFSVDNAALEEFEKVKNAITAVRVLRNELMIPPMQVLTVAVEGINAAAVASNLETFTGLAKAELGSVSGKIINSVAPGLEVLLALEGLIDVSEYVTRGKKKVVELEKQVQQAKGKLSNENFVKNAPEDVLLEERRRIEDFGMQLERLQKVLAQF